MGGWVVLLLWLGAASSGPLVSAGGTRKCVSADEAYRVIVDITDGNVYSRYVYASHTNRCRPPRQSTPPDHTTPLWFSHTSTTHYHLTLQITVA